MMEQNQEQEQPQEKLHDGKDAFDTAGVIIRDMRSSSSSSNNNNDTTNDDGTNHNKRSVLNVTTMAAEIVVGSSASTGTHPHAPPSRSKKPRLLADATTTARSHTPPAPLPRSVCSVDKATKATTATGATSDGKHQQQQQQQQQQQNQKQDKKNKNKKKTNKKNMDPRVYDVRRTIQEGCRTNNLTIAVTAYRAAIATGIRIEAQSYYNLLNLCAGGLDRCRRDVVHVGTPPQPHHQPQQSSPNNDATSAAAATDTVIGSATTAIIDPSGRKKEQHNENTHDNGINGTDEDDSDDYDPQQRLRLMVEIKARMQSKEIDLPLNETAYTAMVKLLAKHQHFQHAEAVLREAETVQQCKPKLRLYSSLLSAYCEYTNSTDENATHHQKDVDNNNNNNNNNTTKSLIPALKCWKRLRARANRMANDSSRKGDNNSNNSSSNSNSNKFILLSSLDLTEREYIALMKCSIATNTAVLMEDALTRLAEDVPVPAKETVATILQWFQNQNRIAAAATITNNSDDGDHDNSTPIVQQLLNEIRSYDTVSEPSPRMGPVVITADDDRIHTNGNANNDDDDNKKEDLNGVQSLSNNKSFVASWSITESCTIDQEGKGVLQDGCLQGCTLKPVPLSPRSFRDMITMNASIVTEGQISGHTSNYQGGKKGKKRKDFSVEERNQKWTNFQNFLVKSTTTTDLRPYDVVIDGANVGYYNQNYLLPPSSRGGGNECMKNNHPNHYSKPHVDYEQIDWIVRYFQETLQQRVLLVMHNRHFSRFMMPEQYQPIYNSWIRQKLLYQTPNGMNDDWFWMHAALQYKTRVVTNDEMRDHHFQMMAPKFFLRWKERYQIHFDFGSWQRTTAGTCTNDTTNDKDADTDTAPTTTGRWRQQREVLLTHPQKYSRRIQRVADGLVVPLPKRGDTNRFLDGCHVATDAKAYPNEELYLCIRPTNSINNSSSHQREEYLINT